MAGALIVLAEFGKVDFAWLDALRRRHYPSERNRVPAHLTLFRSLPPSADAEVRQSLARASTEPSPKASATGVMDLDRGVALRVASDGLEAIRDGLSSEFRGLLTAQDLGRWTPHVTIQNKAEPREARRLLHELRAGFEPRPLRIDGLQLVRYADGQWEQLASFRFRGG
ncbi:MAG TPA: 2'-5' RNA ligase family protein [Sphingomicrobium sp.]|nr:2'-5' RNA ligase family protein [Sphingomicrobium sp.]